MQSIDLDESVLNQLQIVADSNNEDNVKRNRDRLSSMRSLTIMDTDPKATKTLMAFAENEKKLRYFLSITGNYWPNTGRFLFAKVNFLFVRFAIIVCAGGLVATMSFNIALAVTLHI